MKKIEEILEGIQIVSLTGPKDPDISGIEFDSRKVQKDSLFVAVKGYKTDGHDYISSSIKSGASAIICETLPENPDKNICWIKIALMHFWKDKWDDQYREKCNFDEMARG